MDEVIVGTYEGFLLGYSLHTEKNVQRLKQTFASHLHTSSVRCAATSGKFIATGGTDDRVVVVDMKTRKEHTVLMNHDHTVNAVVFTHRGTHLLTGSDDGSIIITRTGNWQIEKIWKKAHGGQPVTAITIHPSDKMALSIGGDKTLRTWNLVKGRPAFTLNLASKGIVLASDIKFSPSGDKFSLVSQQTVEIWIIEKANLVKRARFQSKPSCVLWASDDAMFVGLENGNIISLSNSCTKGMTFQAHEQRVKCMHFESSILYSASSAGELKVWSVEDGKLNMITSFNASCRITCMSLNRQNHLVKKECSDNETENHSENEELDDDKKEDKAVKRKPGAYVTISQSDDEDNDKTTSEPAAKTSKNKKGNKQPKKTR